MKKPRFRKLRLYLRSHTFQRNVAVSLLCLTVLVTTGAAAKSSLARLIYRGMVIAYSSPQVDTRTGAYDEAPWDDQIQ